MNKLCIFLLFAGFFSGPDALAQGKIPLDSFTMPDRYLTRAGSIEKMKAEMSNKFRPGTGARHVLIYQDDSLVGSGVLLTREQKIIAAKHLFKKGNGKPKVFSYELFQPHEEKRGYIRKITEHICRVPKVEDSNVIETWYNDVVTCDVSDTLCSILGVANDAYDIFSFGWGISHTEKVNETLYDVMTAKWVTILDIIQFESPQSSGRMYLTDVRPYRGRSGSGFISKTGELYLLVGEFLIPLEANPKVELQNLKPNVVYGVFAPVTVLAPN